MRTYWVCIIIVIILTGCSLRGTVNITDADQTTTVPDLLVVDIPKTYLDESGDEPDLISLPPLPEEIQLSFVPLQMDELSEGSPGTDWELIKSMPFGSIENESIMLNIYEETMQSEYFPLELHGVLEINEKNYIIHNVSSSMLQDDMTCAEVCVYQHYFSGQNQYELIGAIEMFANGPGQYTFVINDVENDTLKTFNYWGEASFIDLDADGHDEFVIQFPGLHLNYPDVLIIRTEHGVLEMCYSVANHVRENRHDYEVLKIDGAKPIIHISNVQSWGEQLWDEQFSDYTYDNGVLKQVDTLTK